MNALSCIVEGHSEVAALPLLLQRLGTWLTPDRFVAIARPPVRVARDRFLNKQPEFERYLRLAEAKVQAGDGVLILLDGDDDCPVELASDVRERANRILRERILSVVIANREFEAWLIAGAGSIARVDSVDSTESVPDPDSIRDAKGWLKRRMSSGYRERVDQPRLVSAMNLEDAHRNSRSFRKLCGEWKRVGE